MSRAPVPPRYLSLARSTVPAALLVRDSLHRKGLSSLEWWFLGRNPQLQWR